MLKHISQILKQKGSKVWTIAPDAKIYDALELMVAQNIGALAVLNEGRLVGIFSERDYARRVVLCGLNSRDNTVSEAMSTEICYVSPETSIEEAMAIVTEKRCRHLPVMNNGQLVGMASIGDLVKATIDDKDFTIEQLTKYIKGDL